MHEVVMRFTQKPADRKSGFLRNPPLYVFYMYYHYISQFLWGADSVNVDIPKSCFLMIPILNFAPLTNLKPRSYGRKIGGQQFSIILCKNVSLTPILPCIVQVPHSMGDFLILSQ